MLKKLFSFLTVLIVLFGFIGCNNDPDDTPPTGMQVYNADKTTPYTGADLDFYIQGDSAKTICARIRSGKLTIDKINLPPGLSTATFTEDNKNPSDLQRFLIFLVTDTKQIAFANATGTGSLSISYFNKEGSFSIGDTNFSVKQGWNFYGAGGASTDFTNDRNGKYRWIIYDKS